VTACPSTRARRVPAALLRIGWALKRQSGSHRTRSRDGGPDFVFAFRDSEEIGPRMLARIAKRTGLLQVTFESRVPADKQFEPTGGLAARGSAPGRWAPGWRSFDI
jgi:predicted RNA binding protein YcfA (HicA-like mRNA interferase family)